MNYEELYEQTQALQKEFKEKLAGAQRNFKNLAKYSAAGDLKSLSRDLAQMSGFVDDYGGLIERYTRLTEGFDVKEYMEGGSFAEQMKEFCESLSVDIKGDYPVYEMFPYKVKIDSENQELSIDRKKVSCARPQFFVSLIKQGQDRLNKASFNAGAFLNELAEAYDIALTCKTTKSTTRKSEQDVLLKDLYDYLVPMQRFRREYDMQNYAFDIARLYRSDIDSTKDGRSYEFGPSRQAAKLIRILDGDGKEQYVGTIRFFTR